MNLLDEFSCNEINISSFNPSALTHKSHVTYFEYLQGAAKNRIVIKIIRADNNIQTYICIYARGALDADKKMAENG